MIKKIINTVVVGCLLFQVSLYGDSIDLPVILDDQKVDGHQTLHITFSSKALQHHINRGTAKIQDKEIIQVSGFHFVSCQLNIVKEFRGVDGHIYNILKVPAGRIVGTAGKPPLFVVVPQEWNQVDQPFVGYVMLLDSNVFKDFFSCLTEINIPQLLSNGKITRISKGENDKMSIHVQDEEQDSFLELKGTYKPAVNTFIIRTLFPYDVSSIPHEVLNQARQEVGLKPLIRIDSGLLYAPESAPSSPVKKTTRSIAESVLMSVRSNDENGFLQNRVGRGDQINFEEIVEGRSLRDHINTLIEGEKLFAHVQKKLEEPMLISYKRHILEQKRGGGTLEGEEIDVFMIPSFRSMIIEGVTPFIHALNIQNAPLAEQLLALRIDDAGIADNGQAPINLVIKEFLESGSGVSKQLLELVMNNIIILPQTKEELAQYVTEQVSLKRGALRGLSKRAELVLDLLNSRANTVESMRKGLVSLLQQAITLRLRHDLDILMRTATHKELLDGLQIALDEEDVVMAEMVIAKVLKLSPPLSRDEQKEMFLMLDVIIRSLIQKQDVQKLLYLLRPFGDGFYTQVYIKVIQSDYPKIAQALLDSRPKVKQDDQLVELPRGAFNIVSEQLTKAKQATPKHNQLLRVKALLQKQANGDVENKSN
ncbi:hypothetical protein HOM50_01830 [bacterium]|jgi:hypothetical protein|nr:hypothetical protein [bacterium]MBT5015127.1 hypothetical protein [bacterium]